MSERLIRRQTRHAPATFRRSAGAFVGEVLPCAPERVQGSVTDRLVDDDIAIANLHVVQAGGIRADPRLVLN